ncbi:MAG: chorismate-binding protein [Candidatus Omnitrophota bacterium]|jgi:para-aminobenzoate synthetase/4-amino-4-deoxychorismate lyase
MKVLIQFEKKPLLFEDPEFIITCFDPSLFAACFNDIENALRRGYYLAGFVSYEAGYCFEEKLRENKKYDFPLICFGAYKRPAGRGLKPPAGLSLDTFKNLRLNITQDDYFSNINTIRDYIAAGEVYQITYCVKLLFEFREDPFSLYNLLLREQRVPYPAYIESDSFHILSCSPEMFIKKESTRAITKPMKGTWRRGNNAISDIASRVRFQYDSKNRAENVMIADLLRNDLGRIGSGIDAPRLFEVAGYKTLFQMTSTVTGRLEKDINIYKLFASLFPSGSVTGAPKIRAMQIIKSLEREERRIYTGAIGYITPARDLFFNIPIRTLLLRSGHGEMGIGGGIVWDSTPEGEWDEGMLKAKFLIALKPGML